MRVTMLVGTLLVAAAGLSGTPSAAPIGGTTGEATPPPEPPSELVPRPAAEEDASMAMSPATRYASLSREACFVELDARGIEYVRVDRPELDAPVRIVGPLSSVRIRTLRPRDERKRTPYELFDCRLVLALHDFARILVHHGIVDVMHYSAFRPQVPGVAKRGHERALAIDIAFFGRADATAYSILRDFTPIAKEHPCRSHIRAAGPRELREIVCEAVAQGLFHVALTPDYDAPHRDHFHLELVPGEVTSYAR